MAGGLCQGGRLLFQPLQAVGRQGRGRQPGTERRVEEDRSGLLWCIPAAVLSVLGCQRDLPGRGCWRCGCRCGALRPVSGLRPGGSGTGLRPEQFPGDGCSASRKAGGPGADRAAVPWRPLSLSGRNRWVLTYKMCFHRILAGETLAAAWHRAAVGSGNPVQDPVAYDMVPLRKAFCTARDSADKNGLCVMTAPVVVSFRGCGELPAAVGFRAGKGPDALTAALVYGERGPGGKPFRTIVVLAAVGFFAGMDAPVRSCFLACGKALVTAFMKTGVGFDRRTPARMDAQAEPAGQMLAALGLWTDKAVVAVVRPHVDCQAALFGDPSAAVRIRTAERALCEHDRQRRWRRRAW